MNKEEKSEYNKNHYRKNKEKMKKQSVAAAKKMKEKNDKLLDLLKELIKTISWKNLKMK